jgi:hypothetical protein
MKVEPFLFPAHFVILKCLSAISCLIVYFFLISGLTFVSKVNLNVPLIADNRQKESGEIGPTLRSATKPRQVTT